MRAVAVDFVAPSDIARPVRRCASRCRCAPASDGHGAYRLWRSFLGPCKFVIRTMRTLTRPSGFPSGQDSTGPLTCSQTGARIARMGVRTFFTVFFKGTLSGRASRLAPGRTWTRKRESHREDCVTVRGSCRMSGGRAGPLSDCGAAASPALPAGEPAGGALPLVGPPRTRRPPVPAVTHPGDPRSRGDGRGCTPASGVVSPSRDPPARARPAGASLASQPQTLAADLPRQDPAPIRRTGEMWSLPATPRCGSCRQAADPERVPPDRLAHYDRRIQEVVSQALRHSVSDYCPVIGRLASGIPLSVLPTAGQHRPDPG